MRTYSTSLAVLFVLAGAFVSSACSEPSKPIKKLNIKRAADLEPISAPMATSTDGVTETAAAAAEGVATTEIEIVDVQGFRGECDSSFVGINDDDLVTVRSANEVRTHRLAGISIPEAVRLEAQNEVRRRLDRKSISVEVDEFVPAIDSAVYLYVCPDGTMINEELVRAGLAVPADSRYRRSDALEKASIEALTAGRGVWGRPPE